MSSTATSPDPGHGTGVTAAEASRIDCSRPMATASTRVSTIPAISSGITRRAPRREELGLIMISISFSSNPDRFIGDQAVVEPGVKDEVSRGSKEDHHEKPSGMPMSRLR